MWGKARFAWIALRQLVTGAGLFISFVAKQGMGPPDKNCVIPYSL